MTLFRFVFATAGVVALGLSSGMAHAAAGAPGWYAGASVGQTTVRYGGGANLDADGLAVRGGYRFHRYFTLEVAHADLGDTGFQINCPTGNVCVPETYPIDVRQSYRRTDLSALGLLPLGEHFELFARLGYAQARYEERVQFGISQTQRTSVDSSETVYGAGARFHFSAPWTLRLEWDRSDVSGVEVDGYWLGAEYRFGG